MSHRRKSFSYIDLFSGIGGFRLALDSLNGRCKNFSEINKDAIDTYCTNFQEDTSQNLGNITKVKELPPHDLLTGGVPCQSWSIAGKNLGFDDDRGQLWNDTIYLLAQSKPKAFIFENVKGLVDPRNKVALDYILKRIEEAGYFAQHFVINSFDYGVPQNRVRVYILGFLKEDYLLKFKLPQPQKGKLKLEDVLIKNDYQNQIINKSNLVLNDFEEDEEDLPLETSAFVKTNNFNNYFLFNDLRNGHSTIHSWDLIETNARQKHISELLLKNRRKSAYGHLDGNPLSFFHFQQLDASITQAELDNLVHLGIFKEEEYTFSVSKYNKTGLTKDEQLVLNEATHNSLNIDTLKSERTLKLEKVPLSKTIESLKSKGIIFCSEIRYDFKNTKISTGINGINRIFLPCAEVFSTLVASDTHDFIALKNIEAQTTPEYKEKFMREIYEKNLFRKITKEEACLIQGFPKEFLLPSARARWMKLLGNSVSVPVIQMLGAAMIETGVFDE
jgi:DNA (cytosine-5)-methyltransferase 1